MGTEQSNQLEVFMKCRLDLDGMWREASTRFCEILGYSGQELKGMNFSEVIHPKDRDEASARLEKVKNQELGEFEVSLEFLNKSGESLSVFLNGVLVRDTKGNPDYIDCTIQNLSKQKDLLCKLEEREQQFISLFGNNPHPVYYFDLEGNFEGVNDKLIEFTGLSRKELLNKGFEDFIIEEHLERAQKQFQKAAAGHSGQYEIKVKVKDGVKDIRVTKFPRYSGEEVIGVFGILQDITQEKQAKQHLERNEQLFKSLFTYNPNPVIRFSLEGKFLDVNKKTEELAGLSKKELMEFDFSAFIADDDKERIADHFKKAANGKPQHYEVKANTKNGIIEVESTLSPIYIMGEITGLFCITKDITEEKKAKRALKKSEERWQQLVRQNPQPVQIVQQGKIVYINPAGSEYYRAESPDELIGRSIMDFVHAEDREKVLKRKDTLEKNEHVAPTENKIILLNGEERFIEAHSIPISYNGKPAIQTVVHDITDLKEKQELIGKSLKEKETLLREIHHRVKNNLAMISSMLELQIMQSTDESVTNALRDSQLRIRSIAIIHEKLYQNESLYDIGFDNYLKELVETIQQTYSTKGKTIETSYDLDPVSLDINQVIPGSLIVNEVIVNSFKHAFTNKTEGNLTISLNYLNGKIDLTITDDGNGLPENFDINEQQSLGMTLIQALTSQLEGTFDFTNDPNGDGTLFNLKFEKKSE